MNFLLNILYFSIIGQFCLSQPVNTIDAQVVVNKYAKYMVYIFGKTEEFQQFWAGVILKEDIILTFFIDDGTSKENERIYDEQFQNHNIGSFLDYGSAVAGHVRSSSEITTFNLKKAVNLRPGIAKIPQLSLVKLTDKLTLNDNVSIVPLPNHRHHMDDVCVTLSWGSNGTDNVLTAHQVTILDDCGSGIICFELSQENQSLDHCDVFAGGEPIFCADTLVGSVSYSFDCDETEPARATSIYDYLQWIQLWMAEFDEYDE